MRIEVYQSRRVICEHAFVLPLTTRQAWGQLRDFHRYAAHDHFHAGFAIQGGVPRAGAGLIIAHRYGPFRVTRVGRIVRWTEGEGFAFSDLSESDRQLGFPHVLQMRLAEQDGQRCVLTVGVSGRWTAPTPRWVARLWLAWVFLGIVQRTRNALLRYAGAMQAKRGQHKLTPLP